MLLGALGRAAGAHLHVDQFLEGDDLTAVSRAMGRLLSDRPERLERVLRIRDAGRSPRVRVTGAWRLDFKDGASVVVGFLRLEDGVGPAN